MKRPLALRVKEGLDKYSPIIASLERRFQEFSDVIDSVKLAIRGLGKYHWWFTSDEFTKVIHAVLIEDDYSRNVTLIEQRIQTYASHPDLTLKQKIFLDRLDYVLFRCLHDALEIFEESERELIRDGIKIYMSASDGYAEFERAKAALWDFQREFHFRQLDSSRGSDRAIIYPPAGFDANGLSDPGWKRRGNDCRILTDEEQVQLKQILTNPDILRDLINNNAENTEDNQSSVRVDRRPKTPIVKSPEVKPPGILKQPGGGRDRGGTGPTFGFGTKTVHWPDSNMLPLPSPGVSSGPPPVNNVEISKTPPELSKIFAPPPPPPVPGPGNTPDHKPPTPGPTPPSIPPSSPVSLSSSDSETPPSTPPPVPVDTTNSTPPDSPEDSTSEDDAVEETETLDNQSSPTSQSSSSSSSSLPSVSSVSPTLPSSITDDTDENVSSSNSSEDDTDPKVERSLGATPSKNTNLADMAVEVRREVALSIRAYLGRRHNEYSMALSALSTKKDAESEVEREDSLHLSQPSLIRIVRHRNGRAAHDVKNNGLLHWAGVAAAKRQERINGYTRLRAVLKWAEKEGKVPLSPSSIRASTGLRRGLFEPLGPPNLPLALPRKSPSPSAYREATLTSLAEMQPRLDLTLLAFLFNQDALRLFGGLVGERPQPRDLARMDKLLRELELYNTVCKHRRGLIVGHLKQRREFPTALGAQFGDLHAAFHDAEEDQLSAARRCFNHVAQRSKRVMSYPEKRKIREFPGSLGPQDREKLKYLSEVDKDAEALRAELEAAEDWLGWCKKMIDEWTKGWRPDRVEGGMLYVGEDAQADLRRYKWEINQKRDAIGLVPVKRPHDEVYKRQQEHIGLLDGLWKLTTSTSSSATGTGDCSSCGNMGVCFACRSKRV